VKNKPQRKNPQNMTEGIIKWRDPWWYKFFERMYRFENNLLRKKIRRMMLSKKGAEFYSLILRKIYSQYHGVNIGLYSYGVFEPLLPAGTVVGRYCSVAKNLVVLSGSHPISRLSTHPFFYNPALGYVDELQIQRRKRLFIGHDVYIGYGVIIMPKVDEIGNGAVLAAGSVILENVPPYAIAGGNPSRIIGYRFSQDTIARIIRSSWWEKDIQEIKGNEKEFRSFLHSINENGGKELFEIDSPLPKTF
jgi:virginiamycin A acetyltransferase